MQEAKLLGYMKHYDIPMPRPNMGHEELASVVARHFELQAQHANEEETINTFVRAYDRATSKVGDADQMAKKAKSGGGGGGGGDGAYPASATSMAASSSSSGGRGSAGFSGGDGRAYGGGGGARRSPAAYGPAAVGEQVAAKIRDASKDEENWILATVRASRATTTTTTGGDTREAMRARENWGARIEAWR